MHFSQNVNATAFVFVVISVAVATYLPSSASHRELIMPASYPTTTITTTTSTNVESVGKTQLLAVSV